MEKPTQNSWILSRKGKKKKEGKKGDLYAVIGGGEKRYVYIRRKGIEIKGEKLDVLGGTKHTLMSPTGRIRISSGKGGKGGIGKCSYRR